MMQVRKDGGVGQGVGSKNEKKGQPEDTLGQRADRTRQHFTLGEQTVGLRTEMGGSRAEDRASAVPREVSRPHVGAP